MRSPIKHMQKRTNETKRGETYYEKNKV